MQVQLQLWIGEVMLQMGRKTLKVVSALLFVALLAGIFTAVALAGHTHTTGEWYHGLGDGDNNNSYVHPFVDNTAGHVHSPGVNYYLSGVYVSTDSCTCTHAHLTSYPNPESVASVWTWATGTHPLGGHEHFHE